MKTKIVTDRITKIDDKLIVASFFSDIRPLRGLSGEIDWLFNGEISRLIRNGKLTGEFGDSLLLYSNRLKTRNVLLLGMGKKEMFDSAAVKNITKILAHKLNGINVTSFTTEIFGAGYAGLEASDVLKQMLSELKRYNDIEVNFFVEKKGADESQGIKLKRILDS